MGCWAEQPCGPIAGVFVGRFPDRRGWEMDARHAIPTIQGLYRSEVTELPLPHEDVFARGVELVALEPDHARWVAERLQVLVRSIGEVP